MGYKFNLALSIQSSWFQEIQEAKISWAYGYFLLLATMQQLLSDLVFYSNFVLQKS